MQTSLAIVLALSLLVRPSQRGLKPLVDERQLAEAEKSAAAWQALMGQEEMAYKLLSDEQAAPQDKKAGIRQQRIVAFAEAARRLEQYRSTWTESTSVAYLTATFRLGIYAVATEDLFKAQKLFAECIGHGKIKDANAKFLGMPLEPQVKEKLSSVATELANKSSGSGGGGGAGGRLRMIIQP